MSQLLKAWSSVSTEEFDKKWAFYDDDFNFMKFILNDVMGGGKIFNVKTHNDTMASVVNERLGERARCC